MKKGSKSKFVFNESKIQPSLPFEERHNIIEGKDGIDEKVRKYRSKNPGCSDDELDNKWWQYYREALKKKGYQIVES